MQKGDLYQKSQQEKSGVLPLLKNKELLWKILKNNIEKEKVRMHYVTEEKHSRVTFLKKKNGYRANIFYHLYRYITPFPNGDYEKTHL